METKFKKVMTNDRMPTIAGRYITSEGVLDIDVVEDVSGLFYEDGFIVDPEWYLEEITDHEQQLTDLLQDAINLIDELPYDSNLQETRGNLCMNATSLIFEVKNNVTNIFD